MRLLLLANKGVPGTNFLFEAESNFTPTRFLRIGAGAEPATYINGTAENPIKFSSYSYTGTSTRKPNFQLIKMAVSADWLWDSTMNMWYWEHFSGYAGSVTDWGSYPLVLVNDRMCLVTLAASPTFQRGQTPIAEYEAATTWTGDGNPGRLYVYTPNATSNPATNPTNYYGAGNIKAASSAISIFQFSRCGSYVTVENLQCNDSCALSNIFLDNFGSAHITNWTIQNCYADRTACFSLMQFPNNATYYGQNISILNNTIKRQPGPAIQGAATNFLIKGNKFLGANYARNDGGAIYCSGPATNMSGIIEDNYFWDCRYESALTNGPKWAHGDMASDGCAIYLETTTQNVLVRRNIVDECHLACQDNAGSNHIWHANLIINCDRFIKITDQGNRAQFYSGSVVTVTSNTVVGATLNRINNKTTRDVIVCMKGTPAASWYTYIFYNNIITGSGTTASTQGWAWAVEANTTFTASNNSVYGLFGVKSDIGSHANPATPPATITANPLLRANGTIAYNSPVIAAGIISATIGSEDIDRDLYKSPPTIGAFEYTPFNGIKQYIG